MRNAFNFRRLIVAALLFPAALLTHAKAPTIDPADDPNHLGRPNGVRSWTAHQQVAGFRNIDRLWDVREIHAGDSPQRLPRKLTPLGSVEFQTNDRKLTLDEYFERQNVAGLLVIKDGRILYERYGLGNTEHSKWVSFSVAKSVVSMLIGAAIKDGYIESVDEKVTDYLPRLKNSPYAQITIRDVLQMSSGVLWNEDYADPEADINRVPWHALLMHRYVSTLKLGHKPGKTFNYNTAESRIAGNLLRAAIGNNLSTYLTEKVWQPFGMESDANWALTGGGGESGGCCISATLRDYGRIGLFALNDGKLPDGSEVLPANWMRESTTASRSTAGIEGWAGYGYLWWLRGGGVYQATGIHGQGIRIDPIRNVVIALHSARAVASDDRAWALQDAMFDALTAAVSK